MCMFEVWLMLTPTQSVLLILDTDLTARGETLISPGMLQAEEEDGGRKVLLRMDDCVCLSPGPESWS